MYKAKFSMTNITKKIDAKQKKCLYIYMLALLMLMLKFGLLVRLLDLYLYET